MNKHLHIRDFDGEMHAVLVKRAAHQRLSLSQFLRRELIKLAKQPSIDELFEQLQSLPHPNLSREQLDAIHEEARAERDARPHWLEGFGESKNS